MEAIQVIALNDDNHAKSYITREKRYYHFAEFAKKCLLKPHDCEYKIREVYICEPQGELAEMDEDEFLYMFDLLDGRIDPNKTDKKYDEVRELAFNLFWENGEAWYCA